MVRDAPGQQWDLVRLVCRNILRYWGPTQAAQVTGTSSPRQPMVHRWQRTAVRTRLVPAVMVSKVVVGTTLLQKMMIPASLALVSIALAVW